MRGELVACVFELEHGVLERGLPTSRAHVFTGRFLSAQACSTVDELRQPPLQRVLPDNRIQGYALHPAERRARLVRLPKVGG